MLTLIILVAVVISLLIFDQLYEKKVKSFKQVPGPFRYPFIGNGHMFYGDSSVLLKTISKLVSKYGERVRAYVMSTLYILIVNPNDIEAVMSSNEFLSKSSDYNYLHTWLGQGLLTSTGQRWRTHRKFLTPAFHFNILLNFLPIFERNERILVGKLRFLADGAPVDVFPLIALAALDNICESAMGVAIGAQNNSESEYVKAVKLISELVFKTINHPLLRVKFIFNLLPYKSIQDKVLKVLHGFTLKIIKIRRRTLNQAGTTLQDYLTSDNGVKKRCAFLDLLLLSELNGSKLSDDTIREEVDTFMFEGHDTTTSAISFTLYCVSQHQHVQDLLHGEQRRIFGDELDRDVTLSDLSSMNYLELVIKETLRLYPSVPIIGRQVSEDIHIAGLDLPKGTTLVVSPFHMQRLASVFEDPLSFKPERFHPESSGLRSAHSWISFSAGPRNCIGQKFAMLEMKVTLSSLLRHFTLLPGGVEPVLCADLILRAQNGLYVKFLPRL